MKRKVTAEEYAAITSNDIKELYSQDGDGAYSIKLEEDQALVNALQRTKDELKKKTDEVTQLTEKVALTEAHAEELRSAHGKSKTELTAIEEAWKVKYTTLQEKAAKDAEAQTTAIKQAAIREHAAKLASDICVAPDLMTDVLAKRMTADLHEGKPIIRILDKDGNPSALSLTELGEEFKKDEKFSKVIIATKASGAATGSAQSTGAASPIAARSAASDSSIPVTKMSAKQLADLVKARIATR